MCQTQLIKYKSKIKYHAPFLGIALSVSLMTKTTEQSVCKNK